MAHIKKLAQVQEYNLWANYTLMDRPLFETHFILLLKFQGERFKLNFKF